MADDATATAAAETDSGPLFLNEAEAMVGNILAQGEADAPPAPADDPPAKDAAEPAKSEAAPADAKAQVEPEPAPVDPLADLLKDAKALGYKVNGTERTAEFVRYLGDKGAFVPGDKVPELQRLLSSAETNRASNKELYERVQAFDALTYEDRASQKTLKGAEAFHALEEKVAALNAVGTILFETLTDPAKIVSLLRQQQDGTFVPNAETLALLNDRIRVANDRALITTQRERSERQTKYATERETQSALDGAIPSAIDRAFPDADPADREAAKGFFGQFGRALLFQATPAQAEEFGVTPGTWMVNTQPMDSWFRERAENRVARKTEDAARAKAEAENRARQAQKPDAKPTHPSAVQNRAKDGTFKEGTKMRKMTREEYRQALKRGEVPESEMVPA